ncbi:pentapeptide repeat-containing protein [Rhizobium leguminosarum]|uniref:pentapeptide repeat-containing protein n=1 Tax=Rhizobium leguminosarum TaxID=384 RepID=UPI00104001F4|nr:pentapeptide repeat-containing protein [Rhizobium leguminosarum]TBY74095.1 hypothetical protein E0H32_32045 [Rhizobium leguminosarum bv. viciae]
MRDNALLENALSADTRKSMAAVFETETSNFGDILRVAHLDPSRHLRHADLRGVDLSNMNLEGFDFTGCDLRGVYGIDTKWDPATTILDDAQLDGSMFAHRMKVHLFLQTASGRKAYRSIYGLPWQQQVLWLMKVLRRDAPDLERDRIIASALFDGTRDSFVKGEVLDAMERAAVMQEDDLYGFLLEIINTHHNDIHLIDRAMRILTRSNIKTKPLVWSMIKGLLKSTDQRIVMKAVAFLVVMADNPDKILEVADTALSHRNSAVRKSYIHAVARRLGVGYNLLVRDPVSREIRDIGAKISQNEFSLLERNIRRAYDAEVDDERINKPGPFEREFKRSISSEALPSKMQAMIQVLALFKVDYKRQIAFGGAVVLPDLR